MTEDRDELNKSFDAIINASYLVHTRELLTTEARLKTTMARFGKQWTFENLPDYIYDQPLVERVDLIGFGIDAYWEMRMLAGSPWYADKELTEGTDAD